MWKLWQLHYQRSVFRFSAQMSLTNIQKFLVEVSNYLLPCYQDLFEDEAEKSRKLKKKKKCILLCLHLRITFFSYHMCNKNE